MSLSSQRSADVQIVKLVDPRCARQTALESQDLSCTCLAHHELEIVNMILLLFIVIVIIVVVVVVVVVAIIIIVIIIVVTRDLQRTQVVIQHRLAMHGRH